MNIINIIDRIDKVNFGIWNAALLPCKTLYNIYKVKCFAVFPRINDMPDVKSLYNVEPIITDNTDTEVFIKILEKFSSSDTIIITHGSWRFPTRWGYFAAQQGFKWVYTPHGMLEPWGMTQKRLKKLVYFHLMEKRMARRAAAVRAVSKPEMHNLNKDFKKVAHIPNGADIFKCYSEVTKPVTLLFLGRLNSKKCVYEILRAWIDSKAYRNKDYYLKIVGPDDGEFSRLDALYRTLPENKNVYLSNTPVYGAEKEALLAGSTFFLLPSQSEGFPTSVVEAGMAGCVPVISDGCNFPELFENQLGIKVESNYESLLKFFNNIPQPSNRKQYTDYFVENYSIEAIAEKMISLYKRLLEH
ncbi:MAG: glycosyltransferase [Bacteroidales bacterium]|nr:glycosyltransferase [Bacteroidales bacterium]